MIWEFIIFGGGNVITQANQYLPSMAIVRTVFSPRCCETSNTSLGDLPATSSALRIAGRPSSNCTSTTAPITATICPLLTAAAGAAAAYSR